MPGTCTAIGPPEPAPSKSAALKSGAIPLPERPAWRRWLIDVERGLMSGVRGDSIFFVYFFLTSATIAASLVLGISLLEWTVVILALTVVLSAEMFNQSVKALFAVRGRPVDDAANGLANRIRRRLCRHRRVDFDHRLDLGQSRYRDVSGKLTGSA